MSRDILILRPQPGANETAARARALGLEPVVAPLFTVRPLPWTAPEGPFDAVMLTSANAARHGGGGVAPFFDLPCFAVGDATAAAAQEAGFADVRTGPADGAALLEEIAEAGPRYLLHPCGQDHRRMSRPGIAIADVPVYVSEAADALDPRAVAALQRHALVLLHSPRAAALFRTLVASPDAICLAAISDATVEAAGTGWASIAVAARPRDEALLELAAELCQTVPMMGRPTA
ncbi:uroporphyrinogen-III synthase [Sphingosinicella sp. LHD-64]|uniref:uroporphyrinogen-III synthase n=1 Tax=Sphingosinicella sp. LHD-64 TaxID=3072139 RepID=UPI00280F7187|nr:uroporphyrinogen-III synthase [Sphingosinicella sp. LHD-64]MDQ8757059.1 uroporphyrinogen-III synthase [Sphingosinicella sp. LHD-64]